jgi:predicted GTPase
VSPRRSRRRGPSLAQRRNSLGHAVSALEGVAPSAVIAQTRQQLADIDDRRALSAEHTVVGLFGATGSGKSSLLNALVGAELSRAAVRRPTTSQPLAAVLGEPGSGPLLDWLGVEDRHVLDETGLPGSTDTPGLILLDLPDLDSVQARHQEIARTLAGKVDVLIWVTDPQKYADAVLHRDFVQQYAGHDAVTLVILNQIDRIPPAERDAVLDSLTTITRTDGLTTAPVLATSASTGEGIEELRSRLLEIARRKEASVARHHADLDLAAQRLREAADPDGLPERSDPHTIDQLVEDLAVAARVDPVAEAVGASYRHRAAGRVGWPPLRWIRRLRADPLVRLGLDRRRGDAAVQRTSLPQPDAATAARSSGGVRRFADAVSDGGSGPWRAALRRRARHREDTLPDSLDQAVAGTDLRGRATSWWWPVLDVLQWIAMLAWVLGLAWLVLNAVLGFFGLPPTPMPMLEGLWVPVPLPSALIVLGLAAGILLTVAGGALAVLTAGLHCRRARRLLAARVREVAQDQVVEGVDHLLERAAAARRDLSRAGGEAPRSAV